MAGVFAGRHDRQLDPKGRLALPAAFRQKFEAQAYLTFGENGCVEVFTPEEYEQMATEMLEQVKRREVDRNRLRAMSANTFPVGIDGQGRIIVDPKLRAYAELELNHRVAVIGAVDRVEIWNPERFDVAEARGGEHLRDDGIE